MGTLLTKTYGSDFPTLNLKEKSGFNFMSAPGGSLFLAFALYCSHTAKTYTRLKSLITQSMEITNARSHIAFYWPLKSNLGTSIKAETLVPLTLLSPTALGLGTLEHLLYYRAFLPDA